MDTPEKQTTYEHLQFSIECGWNSLSVGTELLQLYLMTLKQLQSFHTHWTAHTCTQHGTHTHRRQLRLVYTGHQTLNTYIMRWTTSFLRDKPFRLFSINLYTYTCDERTTIFRTSLTKLLSLQERFYCTNI